LEEGFASTDIASALLHQLQHGGDEAAAAAPQRESERPNFSAPGPERFEDRPRYEDRPRFDRPGRPEPRDDRRAAPPARGMRPVERPIIPSSVKRPPSVPAKHITPPAPVAPVAATVVSASASPAIHPVVTPVTPPTQTVTEAVKPVTPAKPAPPIPVEIPAREAVAFKVEPPVKPVISDAPPLGKTPKSLRPERPNKKEPWLAAKPKVSRATPSDQTRLWMNLGAEMNVVPIDVVNAVAGETGLPGKVVGTVDVRDRHLFVDVAAEHANAIIAKLNRSEIKGHKVKVKLA
jgi:ATP-dependent RNA helicase DeaD